jgi:hypothetical protein
MKQAAPKITPAYLGDGVADFDGYHIWLYTDNGVTKSNRIALELEVFDSLTKYAVRCWEKRR